MTRLLSRTSGLILIIIALSTFVYQSKELSSLLTIGKKMYQTDRVYSQKTEEIEEHDEVTSGEIIGQLISSTECNVEVNSRVDGGWYKTAVSFLGEHSFSVKVTDQLGNIVFQDILTNLDVFDAGAFIGKGTYQLERVLKPSGEVYLLKYTYVSESEEYS